MAVAEVLARAMTNLAPRMMDRLGRYGVIKSFLAVLAGLMDTRVKSPMYGRMAVASGNSVFSR